MSFLDCNGALVPYSYEPWKDEGKRDSKKSPNKLVRIETYDELYCRTETPTKGTNRMSPTLNQDAAAGFGDRQFMVITSEKQARVVALPSQNCVYRLQITETDFVVRAEIVSMKGEIKQDEGSSHFWTFNREDSTDGLPHTFFCLNIHSNTLPKCLSFQIAFAFSATFQMVIWWPSVYPAFDFYSTSISFHWPTWGENDWNYFALSFRFSSCNSSLQWVW